MNKLNAESIKRIEAALHITFKEWQVNYLLDIPMVLDMKITGRGTGKTLVYIIKLLFANEKPLRLYDENELVNISDWFSLDNKPDRSELMAYNRWFRRRLSDIYETITAAGMQTRPIYYSKGEVIL